MLKNYRRDPITVGTLGTTQSLSFLGSGGAGLCLFIRKFLGPMMLYSCLEICFLDSVVYKTIQFVTKR